MLMLLFAACILIGGALMLYYLFQFLKEPNPGYTDQLRSEEDAIQMKEANNVISYIKNRRESLPGTRKTSFDEITGEFVNFQNLKLSRALSCDSVMSDGPEEMHYDTYGRPFYGPNLSQLDPNSQNSNQDFRFEIPDVTSWIKNPTDLFRLRSGSMEVGNDEGEPWSPPGTNEATLISTLPSALISISYLPTSERLSVVIVRVKVPIVSFAMTAPSKMVYLKAYLIDDKTGKKTCKKKTSIKSLEVPVRGYQNVSFNELMIFKLPIHQLTITSVRVTGFAIASNVATNSTDQNTIVSTNDNSAIPTSGNQMDVAIATPSRTRRSSRGEEGFSGQTFPFGHIILGTHSPSPMAISHFNSMVSTMRKPVAMWHVFQNAQETAANSGDTRKGNNSYNGPPSYNTNTTSNHPAEYFYNFQDVTL